MTSRSFSAVIKELGGDLARTNLCNCIYPWSGTIQRTNGEAKSRRSDLGHSESSPVSSHVRFGRIPDLPSELASHCSI